MLTAELDTKAAPFAWIAARDAAIKSYAASTLYTEAQRLRAERMKLGLEMVYAARGFYITYRKKFIAIKLDHARVRDRRALAVLEKDYTELNDVTKIVTDQGITYRIARG